MSKDKSISRFLYFNNKKNLNEPIFVALNKIFIREVKVFLIIIIAIYI